MNANLTEQPSIDAAAPDSDAALVARSIAGDTGAFARIVARYQGLVCALAYGATGSADRAEDIAQEAFLAAWRQLPELRAPEHLRAWLCGIARNIGVAHYRRDGAEPAADGLPIDVIADRASTEATPTDAAIREQEEALVRRALARLPAAYREPLVLFYREQQPIAQIARDLALTEATVRQRLARGRRLLHEGVGATLDDALRRGGPGAAFTAAVIAALPGYGASGAATAATLGAAGTKTAMGWLSTLFAPLLGALGVAHGLRLGLATAVTDRERAVVRRDTFAIALAAVAFSLAAIAASFAPTRVATFALAASVSLAFGAWLTRTIVRGVDAARHARAGELARGAIASNAFVEYRSTLTLLGLPLVHARYGVPTPDAGPARGWIAIGDVAYGVLFAMGHVSVGAISLGAVATGGVAIGGATFGLLSLGGAALGAFAFGGAAFGVFALGGVAFGWDGAIGGLAVAREFALGGSAWAVHVNDAAAELGASRWISGHTFAWLLATCALSMLPSLAWLAWGRRRLAERTRNS